jgi:hypothetical protein
MNPTRRFRSLRRFSANLIGGWRRQVSGQRKVIVVVNPGAGQDHPILKTMNNVFQTAGNTLPHWQARQVRISADPPQPVQADGEMLGMTPIQAHMLSQPVLVLVPGQTPAVTAPQIP